MPADLDAIRGRLERSQKLHRPVEVDDELAVCEDESQYEWPCPAGVLAEDVKALLAENERLRRELQFIEILADGGDIRVNGIPWREAFRRLNDIVSDPVELTPIEKPGGPT